MTHSASTALSALQNAHFSGTLSKADFISQAQQLHQGLWSYLPHLVSGDVHEIRITQAGVEFLMNSEGLRLLIPPDEARVAPIEALNFGAYEPYESMVLNELASGAKCILDVGANIGYHALRLARREPHAIVHAFEPLPISLDYLQRNVALNQLGHQVRVYSHGLANESGSFPYYIAPKNGVNASLRNVANRSDARRVTGLALTLDDWAESHKAIPDAIKIDVEGAELLVLHGAQKALAAYRPRIFAELLRKWSAPFGYHPNDVLAFMDRLGYQCWAVGNNRLSLIAEVTDNTVETNYVFLHHEAHKDLIMSMKALMESG
jgi:FkbM family methyltransferase